MVNIMMIEADTAILQEVIMFLSGKGQCRITNLSLPEENGCVLTFPGLEIHLNEQTVYRDGVLVPMTYHEFFSLAYLASHPDGYSVRNKSMRQCGKRLAGIAKAR